MCYVQEVWGIMNTCHVQAVCVIAIFFFFTKLHLQLEKQLEEAKTSLGSTTEQSKAKEEEAANLRKSLDTATEKSQKAEEQINEMKAEMEQLRQQLETEKDNASKGETKIGGLEAILWVNRWK